ncbi:NADP-dependent oxidoreductase domain-containing protein [Sporodiniella umbellata]|nr:NADP-dependent oxidoreductase domain-containing protein [Sporodiniella umbellata]
MKYVRFGNTGLKVSRFCLGCFSFGSSQWQPWIKDEEESIELIGKAYQAGINFFDTADGYSNGESERVLGKAIKKFNMPRSRIVVATKVFFAVPEDLTTNVLGQKLDNDPRFLNDVGLSRKHIMDAVDASLERLGLDYIDLYQIHRFDPNTPIEETMEALNDLVRSGKVRYIGASSGHAWEFQKANALAERKGWTKFSSMQNLYNLLYREEEREMIPYCFDSGIASIHWSPLAKGLLAGKNRESVREGTDKAIELYFPETESENNNAIIDRVIEVADKHKCSPAQVALAWMLSKPHVTSPIIGFSKVSQLYDALGALEVELTKEEIEYLEELYIPRKPMTMLR